MSKILPAVLAAFALAGCASYRWTSSVPADMRTVSVPTFRNESDLVEFGAVTTRQVLREFQREGTFKIASSDDAAVEVQGVIKSASVGRIYFKREMAMRAYEQRLMLFAEVSFVDRRNGKVIVNNRKYVAETTYFSDADMATARRDASGRAAEDLARQIVDDVTSCRWDNAKGKEAAK